MIKKALLSGVIGATTLNIVHEIARRVYPHAPHVETIGMRALAKVFRKTAQPVPAKKTLYWLTLAGDLISNTVYYSFVGTKNKKSVWLRGSTLGILAGVGAVVLPPYLGLGHQPKEKTPQTQLLTVAWYTIGGLVTSAVASRFTRGNVPIKD